jgi:hypothetical protein
MQFTRIWAWKQGFDRLNAALLNIRICHLLNFVLKVSANNILQIL